jgi:hypothetical protein
MDKVMTTTLLIIAGMVMALVLFNIAYPAIIEGGDAISSMANRADDRMKTQVMIIHASSERDANGVWQDTNGSGDFEVFIWVKNIGSNRIIGLEYVDVFFGPEGNFARIPYVSNANGSTPYWTEQIEGGDDWSPAGTLRITIHYSSPLNAGRYFTRVTVPAGVSDDYVWGM